MIQTSTHKRLTFICTLSLCFSAIPVFAQRAYLPGARTITDAHNCYPYDGHWTDRIGRALATGTPVAIEQDLNWFHATPTAAGRVLVGHGTQHSSITRGGKLTGDEPDFEAYFFEHIRPVVEQALQSSDHSQWPLITLNLDFKSEEPELLDAVWKILEQYRPWLTTASKIAGGAPGPLRLGPLLVLNGPSDSQKAWFYDRLKTGDTLLTFGAVPTDIRDPHAGPEAIETEPASDYRRWWNNPWTVIESEGQPKTGPWTPEAEARLRTFVEHAHANGLWIRFYTLDGATEAQQKENGWFHQYNFPSQLAAEQRWQSAARLGVDYLASDQYELLAQLLGQQERAKPRANQNLVKLIASRRKPTRKTATQTNEIAIHAVRSKPSLARGRFSA